jgi:hypothetical protein
MQAKRARDDVPTALSEHRSSAELVELIRKLRWIGMEDEAKRIQTELSNLPARAGGSVVVEPGSTD